MSALLRFDGSVVFWTLSSDSIRQQIVDGWTAIDPAWGKLAPRERTPESCLRDALSFLFPKAILRPLEKRDGFAVLQEQRFKDDVQTICTHAVAIEDSGIVMRRGYGYDLSQAIEHRYNNERQLLRPAQVATALVACMANLNAVMLRPTGGLYWLPDTSLHTWTQLADVVQGAAVGNTIYRITHAFDNESVRAVRDAILAESNRRATEIIADIDSGELGERALRQRSRDADALRIKVEEYERILGEALPSARELAEKANNASVAARLIAPAAVAA